MAILILTTVLFILACLAWPAKDTRKKDEISRPEPQPEPAGGEQDDAERGLTARLLAGEIGQQAYRAAVAALAAEIDNDSGPEAEAATMDSAGGDPRKLLGRLEATVPDVPPQVLGTAYALARCGATAGDLVRILNLTRRQAVTIVTNTRVR